MVCHGIFDVVSYACVSLNFKELVSSTVAMNRLEYVDCVLNSKVLRFALTMYPNPPFQPAQ